MSLKKLFVVLFVGIILDGVFTYDLKILADEMCVGKGHGKGIFGLCCRNQSVTPGIGTPAQWIKCAVAPTDDDETYTATMWRIYSCILKMFVPKDQETISLTEFGKAMTAEYPKDIKTEINEKIKSNDTASAGVDFKNIEMIDKLRANYFDIEKEICGVGVRDALFVEGMNMTGVGCSFSEEYFHRGGFCCANKSVPLHDMNHNRVKPQNCSNTLSKLKENLEAINSTFVNSFLYKCKESCHLIQNGVISVEDVISFKVTDDIPTEKIVKEFMPKYYSKLTQTNIQNYVKTNFSVEDAVKRVDDRDSFSLPKKNDTTLRPAGLYGCGVHTELYVLSRSPIADCK